MTMFDPAPLVIAIWAFAASNSSRAERFSSSVEYHPPTKLNPNAASLSFNPAPSLGSLWPFSMPTTPASLASLRHVSSGVSPPISCRSSLVQPIGLAPRRMLISVSDPLQLQRVFVSASGRANLRPFGDRRHSDIPPEAARIGRANGIGVDDDDLRRLSGARRFERRFKLRNRPDLYCFRPERARMHRKINLRQRRVPGVTEEVVERRAA